MMIAENGYKRSKRIDEFHSELTRLGVNATIRKEFGSDIDAACGQLRAKQYEKELKNIRKLLEIIDKNFMDFDNI